MVVVLPVPGPPVSIIRPFCTAVTTALGYTPPTTNTTYAVADYDTAGLLMPLKSYSVACTFGSSASTASTAVTVNSISTTSNRYYAIEMDKSGRAFVNVPWTDNNTDTNLDGLSCYGENYEEVEYVLYRVVSGDSLYSISRRFGVSVDDLIKLNNLSSNNLNVGDVLKIREVN